MLQFFFLAAEEAAEQREKGVSPVGLEAEIEALKAENSLLRKELADVLLKNKKIEEDKLRFELGILHLVDNPGQISLSERELELYRDMLEIKKTAGVISTKLFQLSSEMKKILSAESPEAIDDIQRVKLNILLDEAVSAVETLSRLLKGAEQRQIPDKCSVLEIDDKNKIIILSAGSSDGLFCGLQLYGGKNNEIVLQVITVRPFISAAMITEGRIKDIIPGMEFRVSRIIEGTEKK